MTSFNQPEGNKRGSGRTTRQMLGAPEGAFYIWVTNDLSYPIALAKSLQRKDLVIERPSFFDDNRWRGMNFSGLILDHATQLSERQFANYKIALQRVK